MVRCKGKTKSGKRCKLPPMISDGEYCHIHYTIFRNFTDKYCEYDVPGLVPLTADIITYIDEKYILVNSPFTEFIDLLNNYKYIFINDHYNDIIKSINDEYISFIENNRKYTYHNLQGLTSIIHSLENILMKQDEKTIQIINDKNLELYYYSKKYSINDVYKTLSMMNFYLNYYTFYTLYINSMIDSNLYFNVCESNKVCLKLYKKVEESKKGIIKNIQIINKNQTQKNNYLRLLQFTILPKDIIQYTIAPFL